MSLTEVFAFFNDFKMNQKYNMKRDDVKKMIKMINVKSETPSKNPHELDMSGFMELILQLGYFTNYNIE